MEGGNGILAHVFMEKRPSPFTIIVKLYTFELFLFVYGAEMRTSIVFPSLFEVPKDSIYLPPFIITILPSVMEQECVVSMKILSFLLDLLGLSILPGYAQHL